MGRKQLRRGSVGVLIAAMTAARAERPRRVQPTKLERERSSHVGWRKSRKASNGISTCAFTITGVRSAASASTMPQAAAQQMSDAGAALAPSAAGVRRRAMERAGLGVAGWRRRAGNPLALEASCCCRS